MNIGLLLLYESLLSFINPSIIQSPLAFCCALSSPPYFFLYDSNSWLTEFFSTLSLVVRSNSTLVLSIAFCIASCSVLPRPTLKCPSFLLLANALHFLSSGYSPLAFLSLNDVLVISISSGIPTLSLTPSSLTLLGISFVGSVVCSLSFWGSLKFFPIDSVMFPVAKSLADIPYLSSNAFWTLDSNLGNLFLSLYYFFRHQKFSLRFSGFLHLSWILFPNI